MKLKIPAKHQVLTHPKVIQYSLNLWPPYLFSGISVRLIRADFRLVEVQLKETFYNRNYVGTHFGGSLYAMVDPFFMLMVMRNLGGRYYVWDQAAKIKFMRPGRGTLQSSMMIEEGDLDEIRNATASGEKFIKSFEAQVKDTSGQIIATVSKDVYARLKPKYR